MGLISRVSSRTYRTSMTEVYIVKNKIRLQLRKTRQRVIKNVKRDISKYEDSKEKNLELLEQVKKANIETVLHIVLTTCLEGKNQEERKPEKDPENEKASVEDSTAGEHKIATVFLNSEQKTLTEGLIQNLENFREGRKTEKREKKKKTTKKTDKTDDNHTEDSKNVDKQAPSKKHQKT